MSNTELKLTVISYDKSMNTCKAKLENGDIINFDPFYPCAVDHCLSQEDYENGRGFKIVGNRYTVKEYSIENHFDEKTLIPNEHGLHLINEYTELKKITDLMMSAADELNKFIEEKNKELRRSITSTDEDEPDYYDAETCHLLQVYAKKLLEQDNWIPIEDKSKLQDCERFLIQPKKGELTMATAVEVLVDDAYSWVFHNDRNDWSVDEVKYYQPLPEPKSN